MTRVVIALLVGAALAAASADAAVTPVPATTPGAASFAEAVSSQPGLVTGASFVTAPPAGKPVAMSDSRLAGFPTDGATFGVMSTGDATFAAAANSAPDSDADNDGEGTDRSDSDTDTVILRLDLDVPAGANCLAFDFRFLTEEFPEYVGEEFSDSFVAELDALTWTIDESGVVAPGDFALDAAGQILGAGSVSAGGSSGTTYDGGTALRSAAAPVTPGVHVLYLSIFDATDPYFDSAVFVDNLRAIEVADASACRAVTPTPDPDEAAYLQRYPDVVGAIARGEFTSGYDHYVKHGQAEGRIWGRVTSSPPPPTPAPTPTPTPPPAPSDAEQAYLLRYPDVAAAIARGEFPNGYAHYIAHGRAEGRIWGGAPAPPASDAERAYLERYPDVAAAVARGAFPTGYAHYIAHGQAEGRIWG